MRISYVLTPRLRIFLKEPFGDLIEGLPQEVMTKLKRRIREEKPTRIISVGDIVSKNLHDHKINPQLTVIDYVSLRDQIMPRQAPVEKTVYIDNTPGTISEEAIQAIKSALEVNVHTHIVVSGEEDLLALIAVLFAPENSFIIYGQPYRGIVIMKASLEKKEQVKELLKEMKPSKS